VNNIQKTLNSCIIITEDAINCNKNEDRERNNENGGIKDSNDLLIS
jgi:hypothetical protein